MSITSLLFRATIFMGTKKTNYTWLTTLQIGWHNGVREEPRKALPLSKSRTPCRKWG